ncbi:hypothetical protein ACERZ8_18810 [Tateyamaria armeniaca]|uniref:Uncharacterized protein n=1 Tax=Tateyamaria armeniaca TaxID=2518930 RepID=A0ABW8V0Q7_9RHOB
MRYADTMPQKFGDVGLAVIQRAFKLRTLMVHLFRCFLAGLLLGLAAPVLAEREVHVVAVGKGYQTKDVYALPEARVLVDRPGQDVSLVLLDAGDMHWRIEATGGTNISEIVRSGPRRDASEVTLFDIPMAGLHDPGLPLVFKPWGRDFRLLVDTLTANYGTDHIDSFHGVHQVYEDAVRVDQIDTTTVGLARDYLSKLVGNSDDLPPDIRTWIEIRKRDRRFCPRF